jgi:3-deoxy-manno-octulosonate cytidylyltransferase (CMP-KDO synthetase)
VDSAVNKKTVLAVIPARYASTRFPGKPLAKILEKEMIAWVIEGTKKAKSLSEVWVATDDERIAQVAKKYGAQVAMTDPQLPSGSDRIWAAIQNIDCDIIVNIQGDEPLVSAVQIDALVAPLLADSTLEMSTLAHQISEMELQSKNAVKVVVDQQGDALYFSRLPIPHSRDEAQPKACLKHIGMYAYQKAFLKRFCAAPQCAIERAESLEQLRALFLGAKIRVVEVQESSLGVDTPEDIVLVESRIGKKL